MKWAKGSSIMMTGVAQWFNTFLEKRSWFMTQKWGHGQDMGLKRTKATSVPWSALVHSKMRTMMTIEDTSRTSATKTRSVKRLSAAFWGRYPGIIFENMAQILLDRRLLTDTLARNEWLDGWQTGISPQIRHQNPPTFGAVFMPWNYFRLMRRHMSGSIEIWHQNMAFQLLSQRV
jgi:hypothetical protein